MEAERLENMQLQLDEYELLTSMYPDSDEVVCDDILHFSQLQSYVDSGGRSEISFSIITFKISLKINENIVMLNANLSSCYPLSHLPNVSIRSNDLNRTEEQKINENLAQFISEEIQIGDLCLTQICQWITENGEDYLTRSRESSNQSAKSKQTEVVTTPDTFSRFWIFSHHIYSKEKRKLILDWSKELKLTGFSMPGKPGVICAEGYQENCEEYWKRLRNLNWKRISLVDRVDKLLQEGEQLEQFRRFEKEEFREKDFAVHGGRDYHMDLGMFFQFLQSHDLHSIFPILFGVEGKTATKT